MNNPLQYLYAFLAPDSCLACGGEGALLCAACAHALPARPPHCFWCQAASKDCATCSSCRANTSLDVVIARTTYDDLAKQLLWKLKFDRAQAASRDIAAAMAPTLANYVTDQTVFVHAPTAPARVRARGYDQAFLITRHVSRLLDRPHVTALSRIGTTEQKGASRTQRQLQSRRAFAARQPDRFGGKDIILVDDIITTGATLEAAATTLKQAGACKITAAVFAAA